MSTWIILFSDFTIVYDEYTSQKDLEETSMISQLLFQESIPLTNRYPSVKNGESPYEGDLQDDRIT
jgi:hypothetical protein